MATESSAIFNYFSQLSEDIAIGGNVSDLSSIRGQIGNIINALSITDFNDVTDSGIYMLMNSVVKSAANKPPTNNGGHLIVYSYQNGKYIRQIFFVYNNNLIYSRYYTGSAWGDWSELITSRGGTMEENSNLIVHTKTQTNNDPVYVGFAIRGIDVDNTVRDLYPFSYIPGNNYGTGLVINTNGLLILGSGESPLAAARSLVRSEGLSGESERLYLTSDGNITFLYGQDNGYDKNKCFSVYNSGIINLSAEQPIFSCSELSYDRLGTLTENKTLFSHIVYDKNGYRVAGLHNVKYTNGITKYGTLTYAHGVSEYIYSGVYSCIDKDGNKWGEAPTPSNDSNTNHIATTAWVRNYTPPSSNKLTTARSIDGINFNGEENVVHYTTCSTAAETADKVVTLDNFVLTTGAKLYIRFTVTNTAASPTLNVNSTGAKPIQYRNAAISAGYLAANRTYCFIYDGSSYELVGDINIDTNTKVTQTVTTANNEYPILLSNDANKTATSTTTSRFATNVKVNPSTDTIIAKRFNGDPGVSLFIDSAKSGGSLIENPNADAGAYMPFIRYKSTNGVFVLNGYKNGIRFAYLDDETINSNTNTVAQQLTFSETGELSITGRIKGYLFGTANNIPIGTCSTAAATAAKTVTFENFVLTTGAHIAVKFTIANTASNPTLNVSSTGAKTIRFNNANIPASYLKIGLYEFIYDGTYWNFIGGGGGSDTENGDTTLNNNFNNLINPGRFFVTSTKGTTTNAPMDVTAEWWVDVSVYGSGDNRRILQEARMHTTTTSSATSGPSHILVRCCSNTTWGPWQYSYSQFAG